MRITQAYVYGFGKWMDYRIDFSKGVCIYGENEAGKSTIQKFILFMLFGLPPKQREFYRPKNGGQMGGRLSIYDSIKGDFTIERSDRVKNGDAIVYTPDGNQHKESWLTERLKGMTAQTYQSIFSFSALDLAGITDMKEDDLGEVLLGIGLAGSTEIYKLEKQLDNRMGELFKPYGKKPVINQQLENLNERFNSLQDYKAKEATYREKIMKEAATKNKLDELQALLQTEKRNLMNIEKQLQALPVLHDYHYIQSQLDEKKVNMSFPENGNERLETLKSALLPLQSELAILKDNEQKYKQKIEEIQADKVDEYTINKAKELQLKKQEYHNNKKELERIENNITKSRLEVEAEINRLSIGLSIEELAELSFPFHLEKTWIQLKNETEQITNEIEHVSVEENRLKQERNYLYNQLEEIEDQLLPEEEFHRLNEKVNKHYKFQLLQNMQEQIEQNRKSWKFKKEKKHKNIMLFLMVAILFAVISGGSAVVLDRSWIYSITVLLLVLGIGQWFLGKNSLKEMEIMMESDQYASEMQEISKEEKQEAERRLLRHKNRMNELENIKDKLKDNEIKRLNITEKKKIISQRKHINTKHLDAQYESYPFLQRVEITYWPEFFHAMKQLISNYKNFQHHLYEKDKMMKQMNQYKQQFNQFFEDNQLDSSNQFEQQIKYLDDILYRQEELIRDESKYQELMKENKQAQQELNHKISTYKKEMKALFEIAQVETEEDFYQKGKLLIERSELKRNAEKVIIQLERLFPDGTWKKFLKEMADENTLILAKDTSEETIENTEKTIEREREQLASTQAELQMMESSESYSNCLHQFEMEQEQLNKFAREWTIIKTAKELLTETKRAYRENYLSQIIEKTSFYFKQLTGNKYLQVYAPMENRTFQVETDNGIRYAVNELSKGTIDQLYVSLRLAISQTMSEKHRLPFMIDDAFLHFDIIRTKRIIKIIEDISTYQQIILFTCKKEIIDSIKDFEKIYLQSMVPKEVKT
ncbi:ATP-binding protein [Oceanobacillus halophilus]|uniref:YhaN AAA domain-containing protein n=1 Tax=Oceanobacillus halophilus TaxID=930130 RepID=A0A495A0T9_9BACI|nr:AAA family ATPase [Oceanobacillus halophilus]RKQ31270.1 hypothetical protein D8M06_14445 [Oceanobacillus halophilus]